MQTWLQSLEAHRAIAVLRTPDLELGWTLAQTAISEGMGIIEITWNSAEPAKLIAKLRETFPHCLIGTGTVLTLVDLENAIACGSQFCFTPHVNAELIKKAIQAEIPIIPGALTPTEIVTAWQLGANAVKVFPVQSLGGSEYIKSLQGPLGHIPLIPTGGVTLENALSFVQSGAIAIGLSGELFPTNLIQSEDWAGVQKRVESLQEKLHSVQNHP